MSDRLTDARVRELCDPARFGPIVTALAAEVLDRRERIAAMLAELDESLEMS